MTSISRIIGFAVLLTTLFVMTSCEPDGHKLAWEPMDLTPHGAPVSVLAPTDAKVKAGSLKSSLVSDLTITGSDNYAVQLFYGTAVTNDILKLKNDQLQNVQANRYFRKIVKEDVFGFIYESVIDTTTTYGFRLTKLQGDNEFNFQTGMGHLFSLEEVKLMYEAVQ